MMQLIDFALIGLAIAAPTTQVSSFASTCPSVNGAQVVSNNFQAYKLDCGKWVDADQVLRIVTTEIGFWGCLTACDGTDGCGLSQYIATDQTQTKGSCTLFRKGATVKQGSSNSWTLATKLDGNPAPKPAPQLPPNNPGIQIPGKDDKFSLMSISSGSPIQNAPIKASKGSLTAGGKQDASCDTKTNYATFYINNVGEAYLYAASATPQQLWVDLSGMGQGLTGYTTGAQPAPRNSQRKGFKIDKAGHLTFNGIPAVACPGVKKDDGWQLWFSNSAKPGFNEGCLRITLKAIKEDKPDSCSYTSS